MYILCDNSVSLKLSFLCSLAANAYILVENVIHWIDYILYFEMNEALH